METRQDGTDPGICPACGAPVHEGAVQCDICGYRLRGGGGSRLLVGLAGTCVALIAGGVVWWALATPSSPPEASPPAVSIEQAAPPAETAPAVTEPQASVPPQNVGPDTGPQSDKASETAVAEPAPVEEPAPVVTAEERRAFAKETEESLTGNGLELTVGTAGEDDTRLVIRFGFPAAATAELIIAGPFTRQCERRGFKDIEFVDPSGERWIYNVAAQTMSKQ
ncbi:MAG: zinc ribbon domain-containing protein [Xanthobacter sp.]